MLITLVQMRNYINAYYSIDDVQQQQKQNKDVTTNIRHAVTAVKYTLPTR